MLHVNRKIAARLAAAAGLAYLSFAAAQPPAQPPAGAKPPSLEERVAALERGLASVTTRFEVREAAAPSSLSGVQNRSALEARVGGLERSLDRLQQELQSAQRAADGAQRAADSASRDAAAAQRTAQSAENAARDALQRVH